MLVGNARVTVGPPICSRGAGRDQGQDSVQTTQVFFPHQTGETISQCQVQIAKGAINKLLRQSWRHTIGQERFLSAVALGVLLEVVNAGFIIFVILCLLSESNAVNVS